MILISLKGTHFSIGQKDTDDCTREKYNKMLQENNMVDINTYKKEDIEKDVVNFAKSLSVLEFHAMISVHFNFTMLK